MPDVTSIVSFVAALVCAGPAEPAPSPSKPAADSSSQTPNADTGYAEQAPLDVETLLTDHGKDYLHARARLEAHPDLAADALLDRLAVVPALGPAERKRVLDVLAALQRPEHLPLFATELRRAVERAGSDSKAQVAAERWRPLLRGMGAAALPTLQGLVGDRNLPQPVREDLVEDLVEATPDDRVDELVTLVGRGQPDLARRLSKSLVERARNRRSAAEPLRAAIDRSLGAADSSDAEHRRTAALVSLRAAVTREDPEFSRRLSGWASDPKAPFVVRVAAVRGLARSRDASSIAALETVAKAELARRQTQSGEILSTLALDALPVERARPIVDAFALHRAEEPRLARVAYAYGTLPTTGDWLAVSQTHPWPEVRRTALERVQEPCDRDTIELVADAAATTEKGGERDRVVARAAVVALGRCGAAGQPSLDKLLEDSEADIEQRAEAARQLVRRGGAAGIDAVAQALDGESDRPFARRLATALRYAPQPTRTATRVLCERAADEAPEVRGAARRTLGELHDDPAQACAGSS